MLRRLLIGALSVMLAVCLALGPGLETLAAKGPDLRSAYALHPASGAMSQRTAAGKLFRNTGTSHFKGDNGSKPAKEQLSDGLGLSASVSLGGSARKEESGRSSETARPTTITAGGDVTLDAERVTLSGSQVNALENVTLTASELLIKAEATRRASWDRSRSWGASVGVGIDIAKGAPSGGVQFSGYMNRSRLDSDGVFHVNSSVQAGRHLAALIDGDMTLRGGNLIADTAKIDVGGDLTVASVQNSNEVDGKSSGFNASVTISSKGVPTGGSLGVHGARESGWRSWADRPSSIETLGALDIDVGDTTAVEGALINSETGDLDLNTGRLVLSNLHDSDVYDYKSGGFNVSVGEGGWNASVNFDIIEQDKQGITRATIGAGDITIRDVSKDEADALLALAGRDPAKFQQVLRDEYHRTIGALDLKALYDLPKNILTITNALRAFAAPIPDAVAAQGSAAVHLYRQLIFYGASEADAQNFARDPAFSQIVRARKNLAQLAADGTLSLEDRLLALQGELVLLAGADGVNRLQMRIDCGLMASDCQVALADVRRALSEKTAAERAALVASAVQTRGRLAEEAGWGAAAQALQSDLQALMLRCVNDEPLVFAAFARDYPDVARASLGLGGFRDAASLERVVRAIESGARDGALLSVWVANVRTDFRAGQAVGEMIEETVEGAVGTVKFGYDYATDAQVRAEVSAVISYLVAHPDEAKALLADAAFGDLIAAYESGNYAALAVKLAPLVVGGGAVLAKLSTKISGGLSARLAKLHDSGKGRFGSGVPCCFVAGTPVKTVSGYTNIEELKVGDEVLSQNIETGAIETNLVTDTHIRPISEIKTFYRLTVGSGNQNEDLFVTGEHPFWVTDREEWIIVDDLEIGAQLTNHQGEELVVQGKVLQSELQQTYNITVAGNNNYFAGRLETLVHNCGKDELLNKYPGSTVSADGNTITTPGGKTFNNDGNGNFSGVNRGPKLLAPPRPHNVPDDYTVRTNADGSTTVIGPTGKGQYNSTGFYDQGGKPIYRDGNGQYFTLEGGRTRTSAPPDYTSVPIHHVCTNKCNVGSGGNPAWTPRFKGFFDNAGLNINGEINKIAVPGHRGPHPQAYHQYVFDQLDRGTRGLTANTPAYTNAVTNTLNRLKAEAVTSGSQVNRWLTGG